MQPPSTDVLLWFPFTSHPFHFSATICTPSFKSLTHDLSEQTLSHEHFTICSLITLSIWFHQSLSYDSVAYLIHSSFCINTHYFLVQYSSLFLLVNNNKSIILSFGLSPISYLWKLSESLKDLSCQSQLLTIVTHLKANLCVELCWFVLHLLRVMA